MASLAQPPALRAHEDRNAFDSMAALKESRADTCAVIEVVDAIGRESSTAVCCNHLSTCQARVPDGLRVCWMIDRSIEATSFRIEINSLGPLYDRINQTDTIRKA